MRASLASSVRGRRRLSRLCGVLLSLLLLSLPGSHAAGQEAVEVVSAEVLRIGERLYRLQGIDAPEPEQQCWMTSRLYPCGEIAKGALMDLVAGAQDVRCETREGEEAIAAAVTAQCFSDGYDLSEGMTYTGWAMAHPGTGMPYRRFQDDAEGAGRGLWRGRFVMPWDWRAGKRLPEENAAE